MTHPITMAAVGGSFGRDVEDNLARIGSLIQDARARGVSLLALPEADRRLLHGGKASIA